MAGKGCGYPDQKIYHMAKLIGPNGEVSPLCADRPRKINLRRALWTLRAEAVTCAKCRKRLSEQPKS